MFQLYRFPHFIEAVMQRLRFALKGEQRESVAAAVETFLGRFFDELLPQPCVALRPLLSRSPAAVQARRCREPTTVSGGLPSPLASLPSFRCPPALPSACTLHASHPAPFMLGALPAAHRIRCPEPLARLPGAMQQRGARGHHLPCVPSPRPRPPAGGPHPLSRGDCRRSPAGGLAGELRRGAGRPEAALQGRRGCHDRRSPPVPPGPLRGVRRGWGGHRGGGCAGQHGLAVHPAPPPRGGCIKRFVLSQTSFVFPLLPSALSLPPCFLLCVSSLRPPSFPALSFASLRLQDLQHDLPCLNRKSWIRCRSHSPPTRSTHLRLPSFVVPSASQVRARRDRPASFSRGTTFPSVGPRVCLQAPPPGTSEAELCARDLLRASTARCVAIGCGTGQCSAVVVGAAIRGQSQSIRVEARDGGGRLLTGGALPFRVSVYGPTQEVSRRGLADRLRSPATLPISELRRPSGRTGHSSEPACAPGGRGGNGCRGPVGRTGAARLSNGGGEGGVGGGERDRGKGLGKRVGSARAGKAHGGKGGRGCSPEISAASLQEADEPLSSATLKYVGGGAYEAEVELPEDILPPGDSDPPGSITVELYGSPVAGSPFSVTLTRVSPPDCYCEAGGGGLRSAEPGAPAAFEVVSCGRGGAKLAAPRGLPFAVSVAPAEGGGRGRQAPSFRYDSAVEPVGDGGRFSARYTIHEEERVEEVRHPYRIGKLGRGRKGREGCEGRGTEMGGDSDRNGRMGRREGMARERERAEADEVVRRGRWWRGLAVAAPRAQGPSESSSCLLRLSSGRRVCHPLRRPHLRQPLPGSREAQAPAHGLGNRPRVPQVASVRVAPLLRRAVRPPHHEIKLPDLGGVAPCLCCPRGFGRHHPRGVWGAQRRDTGAANSSSPQGAPALCLGRSVTLEGLQPRTAGRAVPPENLSLLPP